MRVYSNTTTRQNIFSTHINSYIFGTVFNADIFYYWLVKSSYGGKEYFLTPMETGHSEKLVLVSYPLCIQLKSVNNNMINNATQ